MEHFYFTINTVLPTIGDSYDNVLCNLSYFMNNLQGILLLGVQFYCRRSNILPNLTMHIFNHIHTLIIQSTQMYVVDLFCTF